MDMELATEIINDPMDCTRLGYTFVDYISQWQDPYHAYVFKQLATGKHYLIIVDYLDDLPCDFYEADQKEVTESKWVIKQESN
jgi:hypothetical protein